MNRVIEPHPEEPERTTQVPSPIRVVIIEDIREVREGLAALINGTRGYSCVGSYYRMEDALSAIGDRPPDVILTDLGLPGMSGIEGIEILHQRHPQTPILALTVYDSDDHVFDALKNTAPARLLDCVKEAAMGGAPMSPEVARRVIRVFREFRPPETASYHLTPQEIQLLKLLIEGHYKKTAADKMGISTNTVSFHLKNIYAKLQVHSKTEAVAKALRERIV
jgi:DNA-binding NarL/FixJ family response regulator